jgi:hypothetical protein
MESKPAGEEVITSTNKLLSLELSELMPMVNDNEAYAAEDQTYLQGALGLVSQALELKRKDDYAGAMKQIAKAVKRVGELVTLRKAVNTTYEILEAPFLY